MKELVLLNKKKTYGEILTGVDYSSFKYDYSVNDERKITFDVAKTNLNADIFDNLKNETIIVYDGQEFIVKSTEMKQSVNTIINTVEAKHVSLDFQKHFVPEQIRDENKDDEDDNDKDNENNNSGNDDPRDVDSRWVDLSKGINFPFDPTGSNPDYPFDTVHNGVDLNYYYEPVYSVVKGTVKIGFEANGFGNYVLITTKSGNEFIYAHLSEIKVSGGETVYPGTELGISGTTGKSTGPHLHFEIRSNGKAIDPVKWLKNNSRKDNLSSDEMDIGSSGAGAGEGDIDVSDDDISDDDIDIDDEDESNQSKYSLEQYLNFIFKDNELKYEFEIVGAFPHERGFKKLGGDNGLKLLKEASEKFGFIYFADNKKFYIYDETEFYQMSDEPIIYRYNNDDIKVITKTHDIETYIKGYGEKIPDRETKNYDPIKPPDLSYSGKFEKEGTWYTTQKGAYFYKELKAKWGNETLEWSIKRQSKGGLMRVYFDNELVKEYSCYSKNSETEKIVIAEGIKKGKHTFRAEFVGANPEVDYDGKEPRMYVGTEKSTILNLTATLKGEDVYRVVAEYKSPNFDAFGGVKLRAPDVFDKEATTKEELLQTLVSKIKDEPETDVQANYKGTEELKENSKVKLIHKPLNIDIDLKITKMTVPHPYTLEPAEVSFTNSETDIIRLQQDIINDIQDFNENNFNDPKQDDKDNKKRTGYSEIIGVTVVDD